MSLAPRPASPGTNVPSRNRSAPLELCFHCTGSTDTGLARFPSRPWGHAPSHSPRAIDTEMNPLLYVVSSTQTAAFRRAKHVVVDVLTFFLRCGSVHVVQEDLAPEPVLYVEPQEVQALAGGPVDRGSGPVGRVVQLVLADPDVVERQRSGHDHGDQGRRPGPATNSRLDGFCSRRRRAVAKKAVRRSAAATAQGSQRGMDMAPFYPPPPPPNPTRKVSQRCHPEDGLARGRRHERAVPDGDRGATARRRGPRAGTDSTSSTPRSCHGWSRWRGVSAPRTSRRTSPRRRCSWPTGVGAR